MTTIAAEESDVSVSFVVLAVIMSVVVVAWAWHKIQLTRKCWAWRRGGKVGRDPATREHWGGGVSAGGDGGC